MNKLTEQKIKDLLHSRLDDKRYVHSINVAESAVELAEIYGADKEKCRTAGLLHDVTKNAADDEHFELFRLGNVTLSDDEKHNRKLWHAMSGAEYIRHVLKIGDDDIYRAVRYHTTGRAGMTLTEKVIYIADFVSAERNYDDVNVMRALAAQDLDKASLYALRFTIPDLIKKGQTVHKDSLELYNELIIKGIKLF